MTLSALFRSRLAIWALASLSFACLLGQFYNLWTMRAFACWVLLPSTLLLIGIGWASFDERAARRAPNAPGTWIIQGALGGLIAAIVYDLFRLPFVLAGYPLFAVFPKFGQMLLYGALNNDTGPAVQLAGWLYHFSNGAALGIMFLAMVTRPSTRALLWGGVIWAVGVEIMLLLSPYYQFFKMKMDWNTFIGLTLSAHVVFGLALGLWCKVRLRPAV